MDAVILEFTANTEGLKIAADQLLALGQISKEQYAQFQKANQDAQNQMKALTKAQTEIENAVKKTTGDAKGMSDQFRQLTAVIGGEVLKEATKQLIDYGNNVQIVTDKHLTLKGQVQQAKQELYNLAEAGKKNTQEYQNQKDKLEELSTSLKKLNKEVGELGNPAKELSGIIEVARGITAGFEAAKGATVLLGGSQEEWEKQLLKLNAAMAILNGLQEAQLLIEEESNAKRLIEIGQRELQVAVTKLQTAAESENVIVSKAAAAAQWALNLAIEANPILLLVGAIAAGVAALLYFTKSSEDATEAMKQLANDTDKWIGILNEGGKAAVENAAENLSLLKAQRADLKTIHDAELDYLQASLELNQKVLEAKKEQRDKQLELIQGLSGKEREEAAKTLAAIDNEIDDLVNKNSSYLNQKKIEDENYRRAKIEEDIKAAITDFQLQAALSKEYSEKELAAKIASLKKEAELKKEQLPNDAARPSAEALINAQTQKQINDLVQEYRVKDLTNAKANVDAKILSVRKGSEEELKLKIEAIQAQEKEDLAAVKNTKYAEDEKNRIRAKAYADTIQLQKDFNEKMGQLASNTDIAYLKTKIATEIDLSTEKLNAEIDLIDAEADAKKTAQTKDIEGTREANAIIIQIDAEATNAKIQKQIEYYEKLSGLRQQEIDANIAHEKALTDLVTNNPKSTYEQKRQALEAYLQAKISSDNQEIDNEKLKYNQELELLKKNNKDTEELTKKHLQNLQSLEDKKNADSQAAETANIQFTKDLQTQAAQTAVQIAQTVSNAIFEIKAANRQADLDAEISKLETQKDKELSVTDLTQAQKDAINKKYRKIEAAAKLKAWKADQDAAVSQAGIKMALGVVNAWATSSSWIQALIVTAAVLAAGAAEIAVIKSAKPPQFAKGTKGNTVTPPGFKWVGEEGPELMHEPGGAKIITHPDSMKILENYGLSAYSPPMPNVSSSARFEANTRSATDYTQMAKVFAKELSNNPQTVIRMDKNGISIHLIEKGKRVENLNNYYEA